MSLTSGGGVRTGKTLSIIMFSSSSARVRRAQRCPGRTEEELAGVDEVLRDEGAVLLHGPLVVDADVDVRRATGVVAREDGGELAEAVLVRRPGRAQPGLDAVPARVGGQQALADARGRRLLVQEVWRGAAGSVSVEISRRTRRGRCSDRCCSRARCRRGRWAPACRSQRR